MLKKYLNKLEFNEIRGKLSTYCQTFVGKNIADNLEPYTDVDKINKYLSETSEANYLISNAGSFPISEMSDLSLCLKMLESSISLNAKNLLEMAELLRISKDLKEFYNKAELDLEFLDVYFSQLYSNFDIEKKIFSCIISEDEIADNASSELSSIRRNKKNIEAGIKEKLNHIIRSSEYSKYIMDQVITIRNNRYVIPVKEEYRNNVKGFIHDTSSSGSTVYIEPMAIFEMNNKINSLIVEENKEIEKILNNLSALLFPIVNNLRQTYNLIGMLDFISAKARFSIDYDCTKPEIGSYVDLKQARHPLINKDKVVPIDVNLGKDFHTLVITGPNTGGKTVTLKTVGLLCAMAQAGLCIPVRESSKIKVFDNIFADIGDEQSIEESLSTFSSHITNIVQIINNFTENSLILVDELGSGTDPLEGANLAISLLEHFSSKKALTIATTHYHEIKNYCITHDDFENASCEFDLSTLKPTYHLLLGIPGKSNAFEISKKLGISNDIIERASSLISKPDTDIETLMKEIYDDKAEIEKQKIEIEKNLAQVELLRKDLETQNNDKLIKEQEKIENAKREAKEILINAKNKASEVIKELDNTNNVKKANAIRNELNDSINEIGGDGLDLSVLLSLNQKYNDSLDASENPKDTKAKNSSVQKDSVKNKNMINNHYNNHASNIVNTNSGKVHVNNNKAQTVSAEINLLGETVDSAIEILDKYFDNCKMANLKQVRVVHGKGTGKLRQGIHAYLKKSKYVDSFNIAGYGEGDYGVTIVNLKM